MSKSFKWDRYVADARTEPFVLELNGEDAISIPAPDGETVLRIEESRSSRATLKLLCGEHFARVSDLISVAPAGVLTALVADMVDHFGLNAEPPGGSLASSR